MREILRLLLLLGLAAAAITFIVSAFAWFMAENRRLARAFRNVLGEPPDTTLIAHGRGRAAAFSFATGKIAVACKLEAVDVDGAISDVRAALGT